MNKDNTDFRNLIYGDVGVAQLWLDKGSSGWRLDVADELEPKPGIPPSPGHVLEVIRKVKEQNISVLLMEPYYSLKAPELIASKTGILVVVSANTVDGEPAAKNYFSMIGNIVDKIAAAFETAQRNEGGEK